MTSSTQAFHGLTTVHGAIDDRQPYTGTLTDEVAQRVIAELQPVLDGLQTSAAQRERDHELPRAAYADLKAAGFGRLRLPYELGGRALSVTQLLEVIAAVAEADSNIAQSWRTHILAVERFLTEQPSSHRDLWLRRIADDDVIGGAWTETADVTVGVFTTTLEPDAQGIQRLNGRKFYSTGSLLADWLEVGAVNADKEFVIASIPAASEGVDRLDDWDGFGQQLTSSGTTIFTNVAVDSADIAGFADNHEGSRAWQQVVLLAILTGIGRATERLGVQLLRERAVEIGDVTEVDAAALGRISAASFQADTALQAAGSWLEQAHTALLAERDGAVEETAVSRVLQQAELHTFQAQANIIPAVLGALNAVADLVPGEADGPHWARIDQLWRNARTVSSHNPLAFKQRMIGDALAFDVPFGAAADERVRG